MPQMPLASVIVPSYNSPDLPGNQHSPRASKPLEGTTRLGSLSQASGLFLLQNRGFRAILYLDCYGRKERDSYDSS